MAPPGTDSSIGHSLALEFEGIVIRGITEVSGLAMEQDVIETKQTTADGTVVIQKLPGRPKAGEVTLTRGLTSDQSFERWVTALRSDPATARKTGSIIVFDEQGAPVQRYRMLNAWPRSLEIDTLKTGDTSVLSEKLILIYERLEPE